MLKTNGLSVFLRARSNMDTIMRVVRKSVYVFAAALVLPSTLAAQRTIPSTDASMRCFRESMEALQPRSKCEPGVVPVENVMYGWRTFEPSAVDDIAQRLMEEVTSDDLSTRLQAVILLGMMGVEADGQPGRPGTVEYLEQAFERAKHADARRAVIDATAGQTDTAAAAAFLGRVLRSETIEREQTHELGKSAVLRLKHMGPTGIAELRSLAESGAVHDQKTREWLNRLLQD